MMQTAPGPCLWDDALKMVTNDDEEVQKAEMTSFLRSLVSLFSRKYSSCQTAGCGAGCHVMTALVLFIREDDN